MVTITVINGAHQIETVAHADSIRITNDSIELRNLRIINDAGIEQVHKISHLQCPVDGQILVM